MARPRTLQKKHRLTLEISTAIRVRMNVLQMDTGAESATEVIRRALALYDSVVSAGRRGDEVRIVIKGKDGKEESLLIPKAIV